MRQWFQIAGHAVVTCTMLMGKLAVADPPRAAMDPPHDTAPRQADPAALEQLARAHAKQLITAARESSAPQILALLDVPLHYDGLMWQDNVCEKKFGHDGTVARSSLPVFAACLAKVDFTTSEMLVEDELLGKRTAYVRFKAARTERHLINSIEFGLAEAFPMRFLPEGWAKMAFELHPDGRILLNRRLVATSNRLLREDGRVAATIDKRGLVTIDTRGRGRFVGDAFETPDGARLVFTTDGTVESRTRGVPEVLGRVEGTGTPPRIVLLLAYLCSIPASKPKTESEVLQELTHALADQLMDAVEKASSAKILALLEAPLHYRNLMWQDDVCRKKFGHNGTVARPSLPEFATCLAKADLNATVIVEDESFDKAVSNFVHITTARTGHHLINSIEYVEVGVVGGGEEEGSAPTLPPSP